MSSARKRAAIQKANNEADFQRQRALRAEHHANVMQGFAEIAARKADALQAQLDALMLEFCPDEMTDEQTANWARHQRPVSDDMQREIDEALAIRRQDMRKEFERWYLQEMKGHPNNLTKDEDGGYKYLAAMYLGWEAATLIEREKCAKTCEDLWQEECSKTANGNRPAAPLAAGPATEGSEVERWLLRSMML